MIKNKLSQYADDTVFILDGKEKSLNETLTVLFEYSKFSGLNINFDKTHAVWIGINKYSTKAIKTKLNGNYHGERQTLFVLDDSFAG